jgi:hypothetical protein
MARDMNVRIDDVKKGVHSVFWTVEVIWKSDVAGIISVLTMAHFKLPPCKVGLLFKIGVETHVLMKVKNCDVPPKDRPLYTGSHNLSPGTLKDDWQDLLKVPTKDNSETTKGLVRVT